MPFTQKFLHPQQRHRIVEIGAIEMDESGRAINTFHHYINPTRHIPEAVVRVHGIDDEAVADKPPFSAIAQKLLDFVEGATLVIHNAPFDLSFIEHELSLCKQPSIAQLPVIDTLKISRNKFKKQKKHTGCPVS